MPPVMSENRAFLDGIDRDYAEYLRDESRMTGKAESISFPKTEADIRADLIEAGKLGRRVTTQGARTGITGAAVPAGGHILNLSRMTRALGLRRAPDGRTFFVAVQPGMVLTELRHMIAAREFDTQGWSPDSLAALADGSLRLHRRNGGLQRIRRPDLPLRADEELR